MKYIVEASINCKFCRGSGLVTDYVPYGSISVPMRSTCECFEVNLPEEFDDEVDEVVEVVACGELGGWKGYKVKG